MGELGSGNGTSYPTSLDTDSSVEVDGSTKARAACINDAVAAVIAVETALGTNPQGSKTDVKTLLQVEHNTDGTHATITIGGVAITSTPTASAPAMFNSSGVMQGGELAMTGEASVSGATSPQTIDCGTVTNGDRIFVMATGTVSAPGTYSIIAVSKSAGTSTGDFAGSTAISNMCFTGTGTNLPCVSGVWEVTGNGTLTLQVAYTTSGGTLTGLKMYLFFLKKA